ncbi:MAG: hypothetical protein RL291_787 [Pseudomonadota bacterium]
MPLLEALPGYLLIGAILAVFCWRAHKLYKHWRIGRLLREQLARSTAPRRSRTLDQLKRDLDDGKFQ